MTNHAALMKEIETLPPFCLGEVIDFVAWIKQRKLTSVSKSQFPGTANETRTSRVSPPATMLMSEASLAKDWNTQEEDKAWATCY
ncbi:MAG: hypothetical protein FWD26_10615 [Treponema sp.]|nr:hypothetical protein [Treponema sp.]